MVSFVSLEVEDEREKRDNPLLREGKVTKGQLFRMRGEEKPIGIGIRTGYGPGGKNRQKSPFFPTEKYLSKVHTQLFVYFI